MSQDLPPQSEIHGAYRTGALTHPWARHPEQWHAEQGVGIRWSVFGNSTRWRTRDAGAEGGRGPRRQLSGAGGASPVEIDQDHRAAQASKVLDMSENENTAGAEGWYRDPFGRHDDRWFSAGRPTKLVRDDGIERSEDPPDEPLPATLEPALDTAPSPAGGADLLRADDPGLETPGSGERAAQEATATRMWLGRDSQPR
jgi:hypothetical protein